MISELKKKYPENSIGWQCGDFAHRLAVFGSVGDSYQQKKDYVRANGIIMANIAEIGRGFRVGDVIITSEGTWLGIGNGHVAFCIGIDNGVPIVVESNFNRDYKVHYGRKVPLNKIYGIIRAPLKIDLGQVEINYNVFINNQKWKVGFLDELSKRYLRYTDGKLKINFFPLHTKFANWEYEVTPFQSPTSNGEQAKVIKRNWLSDIVRSHVFTSENKPSDIYCLMVRPNEWEGTLFDKNGTNLGELAYCGIDTCPTQIQASCAEFDASPWYYGYKLHEHILIHELLHRIYWINGLNDNTHYWDNQQRQLESAFKDPILDWNRILSNL